MRFKTVLRAMLVVVIVTFGIAVMGSLFILGHQVLAPLGALGTVGTITFMIFGTLYGIAIALIGTTLITLAIEWAVNL